jgi:hypothetical protein
MDRPSKLQASNFFMPSVLDRLIIQMRSYQQVNLISFASSFCIITQAVQRNKPGCPGKCKSESSTVF